ncbi:hypothetical protein PIB30_078724 [Stylosanthes scabra]|uniref:Transmembrane protein n=1 Tax=Stylosanthes scabra TaxID=79078 RepID=A0ABU6VPM6_9FABA|nr:hypothetical protein [Stylosanthes scabra]
MKIQLLLGFLVGIVISFLFGILHSVVDVHDPTETVGIRDQHPQVEIEVASSFYDPFFNFIGSPNPFDNPFNVKALPVFNSLTLEPNGYTKDLKKEEREEAVMRRVQAQAQASRAAYLFKAASLYCFREGNCRTFVMFNPCDDEEEEKEKEEEEEEKPQ